MHRNVFQSFYLVIWCRSGAGCRRVYFRVFTWLSGVVLGGVQSSVFQSFTWLCGVGLAWGAEECISEFLPGYLV